MTGIKVEEVPITGETAKKILEKVSKIKEARKHGNVKRVNLINQDNERS